MAKYELVGAPPVVNQPPMGFFVSDNDWGRTLSVHLDGYSRDGQRLFGIISEKGEHPFTFLFWYIVGSSMPEVIDLKDLAQLNAGKCGTTFHVVGTTTAGAAAREPDTTDACRSGYRWQTEATSPYYGEHPSRTASCECCREGQS